MNRKETILRTILHLVVTLLCIISAGFSQEMVSQDQDSLDTSEEIKVRFKPIVVTATRSERPILRVPYAIDVIEQREIQRAEVGLSLDEVVRAVPGLVLNNRNNPDRGDKIIMRGIGSRSQFGVRGIKIILDGIPLTSTDGLSLLHNLDLNSAGKIEILRGPSSSLYGNAAGGLIDIQTQSAAPEAYVFQPRFITGSDGLRKWQGKISGTFNRHSYIVSVNKLTYDGYREHSATEFSTVNAVGRHRISNQINMTTIFNYLYGPYLLNPGSESKTDAITSPTTTRYYTQQQGSGNYDNRISQGGISFIYDDDRANRLHASLYGRYHSRFTVIPGKIIDREWLTGGFRSVFNRSLHIGKIPVSWIVGADMEVYESDRVEYGNEGIPRDQVGVAEGSEINDLLEYGPPKQDQDESIWGIGPFTQLELSLKPDWVVTLGGRYDHYRFEVDDHFTDDGVDNSGTRDMNQLSPMVGVTYHPHKYMKIYSNFSTAFQVPTLTELGNRATGEGGMNPDLKPERIHSLEIGLKGMWPFGLNTYPGKRLDYDVSLYILKIEDMLIPFQIEGTTEAFYRNAGKTENRGVELKLDWYPVKELRTYIAYSLMDLVFKDYIIETSVDEATEFIQFEGNEVPGVPRQQFFTGMGYTHRFGVYSEFNFQWVDQYFSNDYNGPPPDSDKPLDDFINDAYAIVGLRLGFQRSFDRLGINIFSGINNLFDKRYNGSIVPNAFGDRFYEPASARNWYTGMTISFPEGPQ